MAIFHVNLDSADWQTLCALQISILIHSLIHSLIHLLISWLPPWYSVSSHPYPEHPHKTGRNSLYSCTPSTDFNHRLRGLWSRVKTCDNSYW